MTNMPTLIPSQPGQQVARLVVQRAKAKADRPVSRPSSASRWHGRSIHIRTARTDGSSGHTRWGHARPGRCGDLAVGVEKRQTPNGGEPRTLEECAALHLKDAIARFNKNKPARVWPVDRHGNVRHP